MIILILPITLCRPEGLIASTYAKVIVLWIVAENGRKKPFHTYEFW
jgi:hypothetical protein